MEAGIDLTRFYMYMLCYVYYHCGVLVPVGSVVQLFQAVLFPYTRLHEVMVQHERCILIEPRIQHQYEQMVVLPRSPVNL